MPCSYKLAAIVKLGLGLTFSLHTVGSGSQIDDVIPSRASLGGRIMGHIGWGGPSTGHTLLFDAAGVSPCRCEPLWAGCCGGEGQLGVS